MTPEPGNRLSILVAEDESLLRMVAVDALEEAGYDVIEVETGDEGARVVAAGHTLAGLVTDIQMPGGIDGCALAQITHARHPEAVIVVVSGNRVPGAGELPIGARFIGKPYSVNAVLSTLTQMLDGK